jgi:hypothetical protein
MGLMLDKKNMFARMKKFFDFPNNALAPYDDCCKPIFYS